MRLLAVAFAALLLLPAAASAHPLGNFSVNHLAQVDVQRGHVDVRYIVDAAEIPTLQGNADPRGELDRLILTVDGKRAPLEPRGTTVTHPPGQGGLKTTRTVIELRADVTAQLLREGIDAFKVPMQKLLDGIETKRAEIAA